jgi:hypothetical protein
VEVCLMHVRGNPVVLMIALVMSLATFGRITSTVTSSRQIQIGVRARF